MRLLFSREDCPWDIIEIYRAKRYNERGADIFEASTRIARFNYRNLRGDQTDETGLGKPRFLITVNRAARGMRQTSKRQIPRLFSNLRENTANRIYASNLHKFLWNFSAKEKRRKKAVWLS